MLFHSIKIPFLILVLSLCPKNFCLDKVNRMVEYNEIFSFKKLTQEELPQLYTWFQQSHIQQWWPTPEKNEFYAQFLARIRSNDTIPYIAFLNDKPFGYIQYYYIDRTREKAGAWLPNELPDTTIGIDQFIGDQAFIGKGLGTRFIKEFIIFLSTTLEPNATTIIVDPEPTNTQAIRCYEKVGFKKHGIFTTPHGLAYLMILNLIN